MTKAMFPVFQKELRTHGYGGYHRPDGPLEHAFVVDWFRSRELSPPADYIRFLSVVGPGSFFGGALTIYPLISQTSKSIESELIKLRRVTTDRIFPFGYDGTTESCYCFCSQYESDEVYVFSWEEGIRQSLNAKFCDWIEGQPKELFKNQIFAGYKKLTNVDELAAVMEERSAFRVRILGFEKKLQRPPDKSNDFLPRYNKVLLEVIKTRPVTIPVLTVVIARLGSKVAAANIEYTSFPVAGIPVNVPTTQECYVFDPFNLPFTDIAVKFNPIIDLGSNMRVKFKELNNLLK